MIKIEIILFLNHPHLKKKIKNQKKRYILLLLVMDAKYIQLEVIDINVKYAKILIFVKIVMKKIKKVMDMNLK